MTHVLRLTGYGNTRYERLVTLSVALVQPAQKHRLSDFAGDIHQNAPRIQFHLGTHGPAVCQCQLEACVQVINETFLSVRIEAELRFVFKSHFNCLIQFSAYPKHQQKQIAVVAIMLAVKGKLRLPIGSDVAMAEIKGIIYAVQQITQNMFDVAGCDES